MDREFSLRTFLVPIKLSSAFTFGNIIISPSLGVAAKKIKQEWEKTRLYSENQILDELSYVSFISGLQIEFPVKDAFSGFFRVENHSNSSVMYTRQGVDDYGQYSLAMDVSSSLANSENVMDWSQEEIYLTSQYLSETWFVFGVKYYFNSKN